MPRLRFLFSTPWVYLLPLNGALILTASCAGAPLPQEESEEPNNAEPEPDAPTRPDRPSSSSNEPDDDDEPSPAPSSTGDDEPSGLENESPFAPVDPDHIAAFDPDYPGLDRALVPDLEPEGCTAGFDSEAEEILLQLDAETYGVRLHASDGYLFANDHGCLDASGAPLSVEALVRIRVTGGAERNVVILDLSKGSFGTRLFENAGGFYFDLGGASDQFLLRGSAEADDTYFGASPQRVMIALSSVARINVWIKQVEGLSASLGPADDGLQDIGRLNVGLYDVDTGSVLPVSPIELPMRLFGGDGNDVLRGGGLDDYFEGGPGDDVLSALGGNDIFDEAAEANGADVFNGGSGLDTLSYRRRNTDLALRLCGADAEDGCPTASCSCSAESGAADENDTIVNIESARSGDGSDWLVGTAGDDYLYGENGNDVLEGMDGSDVLQGGGGTDELFGGDDADICDAEPEESADSCEI